MKRIQRVRTQWQEIEIWKSADACEFRAEGAVHAWHHRSQFLTGLAWDLIAAGCLLNPNGPPRSVLMLGVAGGTSLRTLRHLLPDASLTGIELDSALIALARNHMDLDACGADIIEADAWTWLLQNQRKFDVVIDDLYLAGQDDVFRPHCWDATRHALLMRAVAPGGHLAINLVTGPGHRTIQSHTRRILRENHAVVKSITTPGGMNELIVAGEHVDGMHRLRGYQSAFPSKQDRHFWNILSLRTLKARGTTSAKAAT
ncbi:MAG: spermidine synthase [Luteolibacter sp.]